MSSLFEEKQCDFGIAVRYGDIATVERLLGDPEVDPAVDGDTPLCWACFHGHDKVVKRLLDDSRVTVQEHNTLNYAVERGHTKVVSVLLADPRINPAWYENHAIRVAIRSGHTQIARTLLADPRVDPSGFGNDCIRTAVELGDATIVRHLLKDPRVDPSSPDNAVLMTAIRRGYSKIVRMLLEHPRVNPSDGPSDERNEPINLAAENDDLCSVRLLVSHPRLLAADITPQTQIVIGRSLAESAWYRRRYAVMLRAYVTDDD